MKKIIFFFVFVFLITNTKGEKTSENLIIKGVVLNDNLEPIPHTNIFFKYNSVIGTLTNIEGKFNFSFGKAQECDTLMFSSIGYKTEEFSIKKLLKNKDTVFRLQKQIYNIPSIDIVPQTFRDTVLKASNKLSENFLKTPKVLNIFYRNYMQENGKYKNYFEGDFEVTPKYLRETKNFSIRILSIKYSINLRTKDIKIHRNPKDILKLFPYRIPFIKKNSKYDFFINYDKSDITSYYINVEEKKNKRGLIGYIVLEKGTLAIKEFGYNLFDKTYCYSSFGRLYNKWGRYRICVTKNLWKVQYQKINKMWHWKYGLFEEEYKVLNSDGEKILDFVSFSEILSHKIIDFPKNHVINYKEDVYKLEESSDLEYWEKINFLIPDKKQQNILNSLLNNGN